MQRPCPMCGAETFAGARFCRRCGAPVRPGGGEDASPQAPTAPVADEGRPTEGLGPEDPAARTADTSRVSRAELERLLREQPNGAAAGAAERRFDTRPDDPEETLLAVRRPTRPSAAEYAEQADDELTITVARSSAPADGDGGEVVALADSPPAPAPPPRRRNRTAVVALCLAGLLCAVALGWLAARLWLRPAPTDVSTQSPAPPPAPDAAQLFEEKLLQAEALLAQGDMEGALAALREANRLVPSNTKARYRLGELLLAGGRRREAIEEFRAVTRQDPQDFTAWRQLGAAQFAEGLYAEASESYRRLLALVGEQAADPNDLLSLADALRLSGRAEESRAIYQRLSAQPFEGVAALARQRLSELAPPEPTPAPEGQPGERSEEAARAGETAPAGLTTQPPPAAPAGPQQTEPAPQPPQQPARPSDAGAADRFRRGVELWASNRGAAVEEFRAAAAAGNPDAHYYLGLSFVEGRSPQSLKRAEVVAALAHFQNAQRGQYAAQARRHAQQLEREFDRIRRQ